MCYFHAQLSNQKQAGMGWIQGSQISNAEGLYPDIGDIMYVRWILREVDI